MSNFNNLSFELRSTILDINSINNIYFEVATNVINYICENGNKFTDVNTLAITLNLIHTNISINMCKDLIYQVLEIRNICSNWMNYYSTIDYDINGKDILNTTQPIDENDLKEKVFWTCSRHYDSVNKVFLDKNIEALRPLIYYIVECAIKYSKSTTGDGDWDFYKRNVVLNYNFISNQNQIIR